MPTHALTRRGNLCLVTVLGAALAVAATSPQVEAATPALVITDNPTSSAEYLLLEDGAASEHNARVAEYLLLRDRAWSQHNARIAEYLLLHTQGTAS